MVITVTC